MTAPHPFAETLRAVGRGPTLSRPLSRDEARAAMAMILDDAVAPVQLGAFLALLRYRKETPDELAGFVDAARARMPAPDGIVADLDWPSYADRHKQLPYFLLAALLLAANGLRIAMHGVAGKGPVTSRAVLAALGIAPAADMAAARAALDEAGFAYLPIETQCPPLQRLFELRPLMGLRSPANTFARDLNPARAPHQLQGVFHPTYLDTHLETARLLGQPRCLVLKGGGGEVQRNPEKPCRIAALRDGQAGELDWPALMPKTRYRWRDDPLDPARVVALWRGEGDAPVPEGAVIATAALALLLTGRADGPDAADAAAREMWATRDRTRFPAS